MSHYYNINHFTAALNVKWNKKIELDAKNVLFGSVLESSHFIFYWYFGRINVATTK